MKTPTVQDLVRAGMSKSGSGLIFLPEGEVHLKEPLEVRSARGLEIHGTTMHDTQMVVDFQQEPVFRFINCQDTCVAYMKVILTQQVTAVLCYQRDPLTSGTPTNNHHQDLVVIGKGEGHGGSANVGIHFHALEKDSPNNEASLSHNVHLNDCNVGWCIEGSQSKEHVMDHCRQQGGQHVVDCSGSFWWRGGGGSGLSDAVFRLREPVDTVRIDYGAFEASKRLLHASGPQGWTGDGQPIWVCGGRFMCDQLHEDGAAVVIESNGAVTFNSYVFGSGTQRVPHLRTVNPGNTQFRDVEFACYGSFEKKPFVRRMDGSDPYDRNLSAIAANNYARDVAGNRQRLLFV